jgi:hypothetical protein
VFKRLGFEQIFWQKAPVVEQQGCFGRYRRGREIEPHHLIFLYPYRLDDRISKKK